MVTIIEQIRKTIDEKQQFFSTAFSDEDVRKAAINFLDARRYMQLESSAEVFLREVLKIHGKDEFIGLSADIMNLLEKSGEDIRPGHRLHFVHLSNVYLLGLYLYHKCKTIKKAVHNDIVSSPNEITYDRGCVFDYSAGSILGEFYYRWRLASLSHDIGYPIQLAGNSDEKLVEYIKSLGSVQQDIHSFEDLESFRGWDIFTEIDHSITSVNLHEYSSNLKGDPTFGSVYYDHGIYSGLLFLRLMHELFQKEPEGLKTQQDGSSVLFDRRLLHRALKKVSRVIAIHNLDNNVDALNVSRVSNERIYILHGGSLGWLLKIADELQEWYKFPRCKLDKGDFKLPPINYSILCENEKIQVTNYPNKDNFKQKSLLYYSPSDFIEVV